MPSEHRFNREELKSKTDRMRDLSERLYAPQKGPMGFSLYFDHTILCGVSLESQNYKKYNRICL